MQRKRLTASLVILSSLILPNLARTEDIKIKVITEQANIRLQPDFESAVIKQVAFGTVLDVLQKKGEWYSITLKDEESSDLISGYIHMSFVEAIGSSPQVKREPTPPSERVKKPKELRQKPTVGQSGIGIRGGYTLFENNNFIQYGSYGISLSLGFFKFLTLEVSGIYSEIPSRGSPSELQKGQVSMIPIQAGLLIRIPIANRFVPYLGGGIGYYYIYRFAIDSGVLGTWNDLGYEIRENLSSGLGYHGGLGLDIFITDHVAFNIDARYCRVELDGTWAIRDTLTNLESSGEMKNLNFNSLTIGAGLKLLF